MDTHTTEAVLKIPERSDAVPQLLLYMRPARFAVHRSALCVDRCYGREDSIVLRGVVWVARPECGIVIMTDSSWVLTLQTAPHLLNTVRAGESVSVVINVY